MYGWRTLIAAAMCAWLVVSGCLVVALVSLEAEHEQQHAVAVPGNHDADDHEHASLGVELLSQLGSQPGFAQLVSGMASPFCGVPVLGSCATSVISAVSPAFAFRPMPPPGPPPRTAPAQRGAVPA
jgi:hypothetical protein